MRKRVSARGGTPIQKRAQGPDLTAALPSRSDSGMGGGRRRCRNLDRLARSPPLALSARGRLLDKLPQPQMRRLIVEPAMPEHPGADGRR
jgi:hypothetical protein